MLQHSISRLILEIAQTVVDKNMVTDVLGLDIQTLSSPLMSRARIEHKLCTMQFSRKITLQL